VFSKQFDLLLLNMGGIVWPRWCSSSGEGAALALLPGPGVVKKKPLGGSGFLRWLVSPGWQLKVPLENIF